MKITLISDTHCQHYKLQIKECDILIHAGDYSHTGTKEEIESFYTWFNSQPAKHLISIQGNHERGFERNPEECKKLIYDICPRVNLLEENSVNIEGIEIWGSAYTCAFGHNWAFNAGRTPVEAAHIFKPFIGDIWSKIPESVNILVTHGMPYSILDKAYDYRLAKFAPVGDQELLKRCKMLPDLKHVVGGHLHSQGGKSLLQDNVWYHNASMLDDNYHYTGRSPILIEI